MIQRNPTFKFDLTYPSMQPQVYQRLGEKQATDIVVQVMNDGKPFSLTGVRFGFELRNDKAKIIIDNNQTHFSVIDNANGIFRYRVIDEGFGYIGNSYLAYFTLTISDVRITTERFRFHNDEDVQVGADGLQEHYVSVIDDLVKSNKQALEEAEKIKAIIEANQVVKKSGDTMTGNLKFNVSEGNREITATNGTNDLYKWIMGGTNFEFFSQSLNKGIFNFNNTTGMFNVTADTNLMRKTGDTATGHMIFRHNINQETSDGLKGVNMVVNSSVNKWSVAPKMNGNPVWANEFAMDLNTGKVTVPSLGTKKDGRATLALTADGIIFDTGAPPIADRRGNTVTVRLAVAKREGATGNVITSLPSDMRPLTPLLQHTVASDGTVVRFGIDTNGDISLNVSGKNAYVLFTYVVN